MNAASITEPGPGWKLAQSNIAAMRWPLDDPRMAGFVERLDRLNALAEASPGFVWRYEAPDDDTTEAEVFGEGTLFNLSVWTSVEALEAYVYRSDHLQAVQQRGEWFARAERPSLVLWWIRADERPGVHEARERFERLWRDGPTPAAFNFRKRFPAPADAGRRALS